MKKYIIITLLLSLAVLIPLVIFSQNYKIYKIIESKCVGCQLCLDECPVNAISMQNGKAVIEAEKCIGCGLCAKACNFKAIGLEQSQMDQTKEDTVKIPEPEKVSKEGKLKRIFQVLEEKCIGCNLCVVKCPTDAIEMVGGKAVIDAEKCIQCGICEEVCPVEAIIDTLINPDSLQSR